MSRYKIIKDFEPGCRHRKPELIIDFDADMSHEEVKNEIKKIRENPEYKDKDIEFKHNGWVVEPFDDPKFQNDIHQALKILPYEPTFEEDEPIFEGESLRRCSFHDNQLNKQKGERKNEII